MRSVFVAIAALLLSFDGPDCAAQTTHDLVTYRMLTPGQWRIVQEREPGSSLPPTTYGTIVSKLAGFTLQKTYTRVGLNWVLDEVQVFEVKPTEVLYHGEYDPALPSTSITYSPPIRLPRFVKIGDAVQQSTTAATPSTRRTINHSFVVLADGVVQRTRAGVFLGCLRIHTSLVDSASVETTLTMLAPNHGPVWSLGEDLDITLPEPQMADPTIVERVSPRVN